MRGAVVLVLTAAAGAPAIFPVACPPSFADETLRAAASLGFPYPAAWIGASRGDPDALGRLLRFSADAAGGLGHGVALTELADRIGDARLAEAIRGLTSEHRRSSREFLRAGVAYRQEWQDPSLTPTLYPLSWTAASSP